MVCSDWFTVGAILCRDSDNWVLSLLASSRTPRIPGSEYGNIFENGVQLTKF